MAEEIFKLNNDIAIPKIGLGTNAMAPEAAEQAVFEALNSDYRLIDTANIYLNERGVGRGIECSGVPRDEIFLSSKLWPTEYGDPDAIDKTLDRLGTDHLDIMFLHQPVGDYLTGYHQLEEAYRAGKLRAIGISNFKGDSLKKLLAGSELKPQVIQLETHPYFTEKTVREILKPIGTRLMSWFPLGHGNSGLLAEPIFAKLAEKYSKSSVQIILRWHTQMGFIVIPGSTNPDHIKDNRNIFDFELTESEMAEIAMLDRGKSFYHPTASDRDRYVNQPVDFEAQK